MFHRVIKKRLVHTGILTAFFMLGGNFLPFSGTEKASDPARGGLLTRMMGQADAKQPIDDWRGGGKAHDQAAGQQAAHILAMASSGRITDASNAAAKIGDPTLTSLVKWYAYRSDKANPDFTSLASFMNGHQEWPGMRGMRQKAEDNFPTAQSAASIEQWFDFYAPIGKKGAVLYLDALMAQGKKVKAVEFLDKWFVSAVLSPADQGEILRRYGAMITRTTLLNRFEATLLGGYTTNAREIAGRLGEGYPALAAARAGLADKSNGVDGLVAKVPASLQRDAGLLYERIRWRRQSGNLDGAAALFKEVGTVTNAELAEAMWKERHIIARDLMQQKRYKEAYAIVQAHHLPASGFAHAQAQWMAGWLALRFTGQPMKAFEHFDALYKNVETPISKSRGAYWAARASEAVGDTNTAMLWYQAAARYPTVFYGQLALDRIGRRANYIGLPETAATGDAFAQNPKVRAAILLYSAGLSDDAASFVDVLSDDAEKGLVRFSDVADLALRFQLPHYAVKIAKKAENKGHILLELAFPNANHFTTRVAFADKALLHGLIRQESAFHARAVSSSGALGLMQLMPATAKETAQKAGLSHSKEWLTVKPDYNVTLGSLYISQVLDRFNGSYPLAIAAYNGGPGRVSGWLKTYGDPRTMSNYDMIDWIESIPVYETRNYVQRVMESMYVYADIFQQRPGWDNLRTADNR